MRPITLALAAVCLLATAHLLTAQDPNGENLVQQLWTLMKANDQKALSEFMAPGFQVVHDSGAIGKDEELKLIAKLNLSDYQLSEIKATRAGDVIVVTYRVSVAETIDGKRLDKAPAMRLSVFTKVDDRWQWLAHANLKPGR